MIYLSFFPTAAVNLYCILFSKNVRLLNLFALSSSPQQFKFFSFQDLSLVFNHVKLMITKTLNLWQTLPFEDIEVAITFLYLLGEAVPVRLSYYKFPC